MCVADDFHAGAVLLVVVMAAPQHQVVKISEPMLRERNKVVDLTPGRRDVAFGPTAPVVAYEERSVLSVAGVSGLAAEVENDRPGDQDALQVRLFSEVAHDVSGDAIAMGGDARLIADTR